MQKREHSLSPCARMLLRTCYAPGATSASIQDHAESGDHCVHCAATEALVSFEVGQSELCNSMQAYAHRSGIARE